jgi:glycosyltransferase involved in cell wall biosynthesis
LQDVRKDIVCLSTHYWDDFWFRKQHFMSRFADLGHRVLYVEPSHSLLRRTDKPTIARNRLFTPTLRFVNEQIQVYTPPRLLPKPNNVLSAWLSYQWHARLIGSRVRRLEMQKSILWVYGPEYAFALRYIPHSKLAFDLTDDLTGYRTGRIQRAFVGACTRKLASESDLMVVTSPTLLSKYEGLTKRCILVPNGYDATLFDGIERAIPADLKQIPRPRVGFVGVLFGFLDYELLHRVAAGLPHVSFVFVGPVEESGRMGVEALRKLPNVYFLGRKARQDIPAYVHNFDVCINPFRIDAVSRAVSPLKVYEYLACGKPVISTPMEGLSRDDAGSLITFVAPDRFDEALRLEMNSRHVKERHQERMRAAEAFSWDRRFAALHPHVESLCEE